MPDPDQMTGGPRAGEVGGGAFDDVPLTPEEEAKREELKAATKDAREVTEASPKYQIPNSGGAPAPAGFQIEKFEKFAELQKEKSRLAAETKRINGEMTDLQEVLQEQLINSGMPEIRLNSGALISTATEVTVKAGPAGQSAEESDWNAACDALEAIGMDEFSVRRFMIPTLKSYVTGLRKAADADGVEYESIDELLPPDLRKVITVGTITKVKATGAGK